MDAPTGREVSSTAVRLSLCRPRDRSGHRRCLEQLPKETQWRTQDFILGFKFNEILAGHIACHISKKNVVMQICQSINHLFNNILDARECSRYGVRM